MIWEYKENWEYSTSKVGIWCWTKKIKNKKSGNNIGIRRGNSSFVLFYVLLTTYADRFHIPYESNQLQLQAHILFSRSKSHLPTEPFLLIFSQTQSFQPYFLPIPTNVTVFFKNPRRVRQVESLYVQGLLQSHSGEGSEVGFREQRWAGIRHDPVVSFRLRFVWFRPCLFRRGD